MAPHVTLPPRLRRAEPLAQRRLGEETVVLDPRGGRFYGLNLPAGDLLELLKVPRDTAALRAWAASAGDADGSLEGFLSEALGHGLVLAASDGEGPGEPPPPAVAPWAAPLLLWQEEVTRVTTQVSPPQLITNPQCLP